jgi:hypothetical protein
MRACFFGMKMVEVRQFLEIFNFCHFLLSPKWVSAKLVSAIWELFQRFAETIFVVSAIRWN